ncbi:hypothetical protein ACYZUC_26515 [Pseudomonas sp. GT1P32]
MVAPRVTPPKEFNSAESYPYPPDSLPQPNTFVANPLRFTGLAYFFGSPNSTAGVLVHYEDERQYAVRFDGSPYDVSVPVDPGPMQVFVHFMWIEGNKGDKAEFIFDIYVLTPPS